jgi:hypothetical protein
MRRLITILTATMLLTACSGGLGGIVRNNSVCINTLNTNNSKLAVCVSEMPTEDETNEEAAPGLLVGFLLNR